MICGGNSRIEAATLGYMFRTLGLRSGLIAVECGVCEGPSAWLESGVTRSLFDGHQ